MAAPTPQVIHNPVEKKGYCNESPCLSMINVICLFAAVIITWFVEYSIFLLKPSILLMVLQDRSCLRAINANEMQSWQAMELKLEPLSFEQKEVALNVWLLLSGPIICLVLFKFSYWLPKFCTVVGLVFFTLLAVNPVANIYKAIYDSFYVSSAVITERALAIFEDSSKIVLYVVVLNSAVTAKLSRLAEVMRQTSQAILYFPLLFLLGALSLSLSSNVIVLSVMVYNYFDSGTGKAFAVLVGSYLFLFIFHFVVGLISQCVFTWYRAQLNDRNLSERAFIYSLFIRSLDLIVRNHGGGILGISTLIGPIVGIIFLPASSNKTPPPVYPGCKGFFVKRWLVAYGFACALPLAAADGLESTRKMIYALFTRITSVNFAFCAVFATLLAVFTEIAKLIWMSVAIAVLPNLSLINCDQLTDMYAETTVYHFGSIVITSAAIGASVLMYNTRLELEDAVEGVLGAPQDDCAKPKLVAESQAP